MGLKSMHEQSKQENSSNLELIEQQSQIIEKYKEQISELSSTNSTLMSELQTRSEKIKSLNEQIEKLAESDKELKHSRELLRESEQKLQESQRLQSIAEASRDKATREMNEAVSMKNMLQTKINDGIEREKNRLEKEKEKTIKSNNLNHYSKVGSLTVALSLYCLIMTILWLIDHSEPLKTIPKWFSNRGENLKAIWNGIVAIHTLVYKLLEPHMNDFIAKAIPFILLLALVGAFGYFVLWKGFWALLEKWSDLWSHYDYKSQKLLKASITVAIITVSIPLAILLVEVIPLSLNVLSWWLILSIGLNVGYHAITYRI